MKKVTGIGGIFFKSKNPKALNIWYEKHLGIQTDAYGSTFEWKQADSSEKKGFTQWSAFDIDTNYFDPSIQEFMINYRVENLENLLVLLKSEGVQVLKEIETFSYGKFAHILDLEGRKIELWEPNDDEFDKIADARVK